MKHEIETKAIIVIDEIDKLVRQVRICISFIQLYSLIVLPQLKPVMKVSNMISCPSLMVLQSLLTQVGDNICYIYLIIETKVNTRNILFVGAGAFEKVKPTDLAIEL